MCILIQLIMQCLYIRNVHTELTQMCFTASRWMCRIKYLCHSKTSQSGFSTQTDLGEGFPTLFLANFKLKAPIPKTPFSQKCGYPPPSPPPHTHSMHFITIFCIKRINCLIYIIHDHCTDKRPTTIIYVYVTWNWRRTLTTDYVRTSLIFPICTQHG